MKSITVAAKKGAGATKYCYGCGAKIVSTKDIDTLTQEAGAKVRDKHASGDVQMGQKSSKGGFWNEQKDILNISKIKNWALCPRCKELQKKSASGTIDNQLLKELSPSHEMTEIFREQVSKIRSKENAVVVLCCDAVNPRGSLIKGIRNYVGGNPILLAVTRCDLLPAYMTEDWSIERRAGMKKFYKHQAKELNPADVYLCSVDADHYEEDIFNGSQQLSSELLKYLNGRDTYVIGAANIGKSTLTDRLINNIIKTHQLKEEAPWAYRKRLSKKEQKKRRYGRSSEERLEEKRYKTIQDARVTKSSLPGTTLNNVRVPCFADHTQAVWDTPGLLLDPSLKHYPIRDFARIKAMKPSKVVPQWHDSGDRKSFALLVYEKSNQCNNTDIIPLLRIEIRLRKPKDAQSHDDAAPVKLVWNSILNPILLTSISSIEEAHSLEDGIEKAARDAAQKRREEAKSIESVQRTPEEKAKEKERKRKLFLEKRREPALQKKKEDELHQQKQLKMSSTLSLVKKEKLKAGKASELTVEHFGSLGILSPSCSALVMVYAPSTGIVPSFHDVMTVPSQWEADVSIDDDETDEEEDELEDDDFVFDHLEEDDEEWDEWTPNDDDAFDFESWNNAERDHGVTVDDADDIWSEYKGEKVGWRFDKKPRYVKGKFVDGWQPIEDKNN